VRFFLVLLPFISYAAPVSIPVTFEKREPRLFLARLNGGTAEVRPDRVTLGDVVLRFAGAQPGARIEPIGVSTPSTYIRQGAARTFAQFPKVAIRGIYPGVDAIFYATRGQLEYDLELAPGARADEIRLRWEGAGEPRIDARGDLLVGIVRQSLPRVFQGGRVVAAHYEKVARRDVAIRLGPHDSGAPLTIDPILSFVQPLGGGGLVTALASDAQGNIYAAGSTNSPTFPTTANAFNPHLEPPLFALNSGQVTPLPVDGAISISVVGGTSDGKILYASSPTGDMYLSIDSGATWKVLSHLPTNGPVNSIAVDAITPSNVFVATSRGLFRSGDAGQTWFNSEIGLPIAGTGYVAVSQIFINPNDHLIAYAVTAQVSVLQANAVYKSTDAGNSWRQLDLTYPGAPAPLQFPLTPTLAAFIPDGTSIFALDTYGTLLKSTDGGATWQPLARQQFFGTSALLIDPSNPNTLYALDSKGVVRSTDGGATFTTTVPVNPGSGTPTVPRAIAVDAAGVLYISTPSLTFFSTDGGVTQKPLSSLVFTQSLTGVGGTVYGGQQIPAMPFIVKLDPSGTRILYSTFFGGSSFGDSINALAVDAQGNAIVVGIAQSSDFPVTISGTGSPALSNFAGFVAKLSADGTRPLFSRFLGNSNIRAVTVDAAGSIYVTGFAGGIPTTANALQPAPPTTPCARKATSFFISPNLGTNAFVTKISADGNTLQYSTYLTGSCGSLGEGVAVAATGEATVTGYTTSPDFPTSANSYQSVFPDPGDQPSPPNLLQAGFVAKLSAAGDKLLAGTFVGGGFSTIAGAVALDAAGNAYVTGSTQGITPGATPGAFQQKFVDRCSPRINIGPGPPYTGSVDAYLLKLDPTLSTARFLTYLGGSCDDYGTTLALDASGNIWVAGVSSSPDFPLVTPFEVDGFNFVSEFSPDASSLLFSSKADGSALALGANGSVFVGGNANGPLFVAKLDARTDPSIFIDSVAPTVNFPLGSISPTPPAIAQGQLVRITGRKLGPADKIDAKLDATGRLPFVLGNTIVTFGGIPAPLLSVQDNLIVCFVPFEATGAVQVVVTNGSQRSNPVRDTILTSAPQILTIVNADGTLNSSDHPAKGGSTIALYLSGLGETSPLSVDGLISTPPLLPVPTVTVRTFVNQSEIKPSFVGAAPGMIAGITQVNVQLPASVLNNASVVTIAVNSTAAALYFAP
jgi:uncharacterized protein (TIGR03437 family)